MAYAGCRYDCNAVLYYAFGILLFNINIDNSPQAVLAAAINLITNANVAFKNVDDNYIGLKRPFTFARAKAREVVEVLFYALYISQILFVVVASKLGDPDLVKETIKHVLGRLVSTCRECKFYSGVLVDIVCRNTSCLGKSPKTRRNLKGLVFAHTINGVKLFYEDPSIHLFETMNLRVVDALEVKGIIAFVWFMRVERAEHVKLLVLSSNGTRRAMEIAYEVLRALNEDTIECYGENSRIVVA